ncbi:YbaN family protein [Reinekea marina]|uniref:Inner membrane protein n=1 Tax=Reinekea marina TaxID=1310421 RepID=A0ABV7WWS1_9GAMM
MKWVIFTLGWLCMFLGIAGIVLPILPTTPFILLAATCFAKSSPRFHAWLLANKVFGQLIQNWNQERYIEPAVKRRSLIIIALTFGLSIYIVDPIGLKVMLSIFWIVCTFCVSRLSTIPLSIRQKKAAKL